jgi:hypothetical protein
VDEFVVDEDWVRKRFGGEPSDQQLVDAVLTLVSVDGFDAIESAITGEGSLDREHCEHGVEVDVVRFCASHAVEHARAEVDSAGACWWCTAERIAAERAGLAARGQGGSADGGA